MIKSSGSLGRALPPGGRRAELRVRAHPGPERRGQKAEGLWWVPAAVPAPKATAGLSRRGPGGDPRDGPGLEGLGLQDKETHRAGLRPPPRQCPHLLQGRARGWASGRAWSPCRCSLGARGTVSVDPECVVRGERTPGPRSRSVGTGVSQTSPFSRAPRRTGTSERGSPRPLWGLEACPWTAATCSRGPG